MRPLRLLLIRIYNHCHYVMVQIWSERFVWDIELRTGSSNMLFPTDITVTHSSSVNQFIISDDNTTTSGVYFDHHKYNTSGESWKSFREELHQFSLLPSQTSFYPPFTTLSKHCHDGFTAPLDQQEEALYRISSPHLCYPLTCAGWTEASPGVANPAFPSPTSQPVIVAN